MTFPKRLVASVGSLRFRLATWLPALCVVMMTMPVHVAVAQVYSCGDFCNGYYDKQNNWKVLRTPITTNVNGTPTQTGLNISILAPGGLSVSYQYQDTPGDCNASVTLTFTRYGAQQGPSSLYTGQCIMSGKQALVEASKPEPLCNYNSTNASSWTNCTFNPICPQAGTGTQYYCGSSGTNPQTCPCTPSSNPAGLGSACITNGQGGGYYYCGTSAVCNCTPQSSPAAQASYCPSIGTAPAGCIPTPNSNNLVAAQTLTSQYTATIEQGMEQLVSDKANVAPAGLVNAILGLSKETDGCTVAR